MPFYSDDIIEEVRSRNDIVDVISQYVHLQKKARPTLDSVLFIMRKQVPSLLHQVSRCTTASAVEPVEMCSPF